MLELNTEGLEPSIVEMLKSEKVAGVISAALEAAKNPLVTKRDELLGQISQYKQMATQIESLGGMEALTVLKGSVDEIERKRQEAAQKALEASGDIEKIKGTYSRQLAEKDTQLQSLQSAIIKKEMAMQLNSAISNAKGVPELLSPVINSRIRSELQTDGSVKVVVLGKDGTPMLNSDGKDAGLSDLIVEFKNDPIYGRAFEATNVSGAGTQVGAASSKTADNPFAKANWNVTRQLQLYKQNPAEYNRLKSEAGG